LHHLAIFGMTQLSGKTTTLEALISRSLLKAIAFITKRGEAGFTRYNLVTPYYKPRADWQFVEGLVNVALGEKVKYEPGMRYGIMKVCKGRKDLKEIQKAALEFARESKREFMKAVYEKLAAYLDIVIPELEKWVFTDKLDLSEGINVMDLSSMRLETQHLVIASTIEYAFQNLDHVIVIIPEAWESIPQGKMTPVKWVAQQFIRKGAALGNYMFLDSQDIGGIDKTPLRQCDNWLMGRMKEAHEVERILKQLLGMKLGAEQIQTLPLGHFYAAIGNDVKKVYVLPVGVPEEVGRKVALGELSPEYVRDNFLKPKVMEVDDLIWKEKYEKLKTEFERRVQEEKDKAYKDAIQKVEAIKKTYSNVGELRETIAKLKDENVVLQKDRDEFQRQLTELLEARLSIRDSWKKLFAWDYQVVRPPGFEPGTSVPSDVSVSVEQPALTVKVERKSVELTDKTTEGKIAIIYAEGKLPTDKWFTTTDVVNAFVSHGWPRDPRIGPTLDKMCQWSFFEKHYAGKRPEYRVKVKPEDARGKGLLKEVEA
jgi:regulator of replication initiation timing